MKVKISTLKFSPYWFGNNFFLFAENDGDDGFESLQQVLGLSIYGGGGGGGVHQFIWLID